MKLVRQRGKHDCGIAAIAMAVGVGYDDIAQFLPPNRRGTAMTMGMTYHDLFEACNHFGKAFQYVSQWDRFGLNRVPGATQFPRRDPWPPAPWAPSHLVQIPGHYVAMDAGGRIFDPAGITRTCLPEDTQIVIGIFDCPTPFSAA